MGRFMAREELIPGRVLCSGAQRAVESWEMVSAALGVDVPVEIRDEIYGSSPGTLMKLIRLLPNEEDSVLLVGHNPTFESLALQLAGSGNEEALQTLAFKYPTGALAILDFAVRSWEDIGWGAGYLRDFIRPKALK